MIGRVVLPALAGCVQLAAALVVLGRPDPVQARGFLFASVPTVQETLAALELLIWALVTASLAVGLLSVASAGASAVRLARGRVWEVSVAAVGLLLLTAGVAHHTAPPTTVGGGGSVQEAQLAIGR